MLSAYETEPVATPSSGTFSPPVAAPPRDAFVSDALLAGATYVDGVFPVREEVFPAWLLEDYEHWYEIDGKILIAPARYELGLVTDDISRSGLIWNNREADATLLVIDVLNPVGIILSGIAEGQVIPGRQDNVHSYLIIREGPASIDSRFEYQFGSENVEQTITGFRGVVFPFRPRDSGYAEGREWSTDVFRSDSGTERRGTLTNDTPPRTVVFPLRSHRFEERAAAENLLRFGARYAFLVPLWFSASRLTLATDGTETVSASTTDREFAVGGFVALIRDDVRNPFSVVRQIASITGSSITFTDVVDAAQFAVGSWCIPAIPCALPRGTNWRDASSRYGDLDVTFEEL
jgi:hypothetical protein